MDREVKPGRSNENNLLSITDALKRTTSFAYNARGWATQATFPSNYPDATTVSYTHE